MKQTNVKLKYLDLTIYAEVKSYAIPEAPYELADNDPEAATVEVYSAKNAKGEIMPLFDFSNEEMLKILAAARLAAWEAEQDEIGPHASNFPR